MRGYVLFRTDDGGIARVEAERSARGALIRLLENTVPEGVDVLGLVIDVDTSTHLQVVSA